MGALRAREGGRGGEWAQQDGHGFATGRTVDSQMMHPGGSGFQQQIPFEQCPEQQSSPLPQAWLGALPPDPMQQALSGPQCGAFGPHWESSVQLSP